jgi:hypothetical protein
MPRKVVTFGVPLLTAGVLAAHPTEPSRAMELAAFTDPWLAVHIGLLICLPLLAITVWLLLDGIDGTAAAVSRIALPFFAAFYAAFDGLMGIATGVLVREAAAAAPERQDAAIALAETWWNVPAPLWLLGVLGPLSWVVATAAAAIAHHRAGSGRLVVGALAVAGPLFAFGHPFVTGPLAMLALLTAALLITQGTEPEPVATGRRSSTGLAGGGRGELRQRPRL